MISITPTCTPYPYWSLCHTENLRMQGVAASNPKLRIPKELGPHNVEHVADGGGCMGLVTGASRCLE